MVFDQTLSTSVDRSSICLLDTQTHFIDTCEAAAQAYRIWELSDIFSVRSSPPIAADLGPELNRQ